ncbi:MAG: cupin domain-containing protein [Kangiellaceae bacterium]|nr:cupin domain-containing protein [Kangiellaceae bacterium]
MSKAINIEQCFEKFTDTFSPKVVAQVNSQNIMLVRLEGDKVPWHSHQNEDEMFLVLDGVLDIYLRDDQITLNPGEFYVVPKGVEHRVVPREKVKLMLIEPDSTAHTGDVKSEITKAEYEKLSC